MSKIGKQPVLIPEGVKVEVEGRVVKVSGSKGNLSLDLPKEVEVKIEADKVEVSRKNNSKRALSIHGTIRSLINNMIRGVSVGWVRQLELVGTGFKADTSGESLNLIVGYSHPVKIDAPEGVTFKVEKNIITVEGVDRGAVGQAAANIRDVRPPEPYKGKGIKYVEEVVRRKPGKAAAKAVAA